MVVLDGTPGYIMYRPHEEEEAAWQILVRFLDFHDKFVSIIQVLDDSLAFDECKVLVSGGNKALEARRVGFIAMSNEVLSYSSFYVLPEVVVLP